VAGGLLSLIAAGAVSWLVAGRALRPLDAMASTAEDIGRTQDLSRRLPENAPDDEVGRLQKSFNQMLRQLEDAYHRLQAALVAQRRFVADASHELRTPLTLIRTNVEAWLRRASGPNKAYARNIIDEVEQLNRIVGDLTTLALADAKQLPIERQPLELNAMVRDLMTQAEPLAQERGVDLRPELNGGVRVEADPTRVRQLLLILMDNALRHTPSGGLVSVGVVRENGHARITVTDSGEGIPAADLPHIFERFYRADKARNRENGGSGLGLAIAKWIVDAHRGDIAVKSAEGKGTEVEVNLPAMS